MCDPIMTALLLSYEQPNISRVLSPACQRRSSSGQPNMYPALFFDFGVLQKHKWNLALAFYPDPRFFSITQTKRASEFRNRNFHRVNKNI